MYVNNSPCKIKRICTFFHPFCANFVSMCKLPNQTNFDKNTSLCSVPCALVPDACQEKRELSSAHAYITFDIKIMLLIEHLRLRSAYGIAVRLKAIYHRLDDKVYPRYQNHLSFSRLTMKGCEIKLKTTSYGAKPYLMTDLCKYAKFALTCPR